MSKLLRQRFPSPCDPKWLKQLTPGTSILYCYGGSASHIEPVKAVMVKRGESFIEAQPEGFMHSVRLNIDGCLRFHNTHYFMYLMPSTVTSTGGEE